MDEFLGSSTTIHVLYKMSTIFNLNNKVYTSHEKACLRSSFVIKRDELIAVVASREFGQRCVHFSDP